MEEVIAALVGEVRSLRKAAEEGRRRPLLMTQTMVARELSLSQRTVKRMIARGELATVQARSFRRSLVATEEVERWIRDHSVTPDTRQKKRHPKTEAQKIRDLAKT
jgi:excisionase family DNA binding protein